MTEAKIPFADLALREDAGAVRAAIDRVLARAVYVLGPEVEAFEREFAAASGVRHAVGVGTGTDALALILRGLGIGPGDEIITTPLSAGYTAIAILMAGARPVFADVDGARLTLDPEAVSRAVTPRTKAILPVHLYGQAANMAGLMRVAGRHNLAVVEDCCQSHLATAHDQPVGTFGIAGAFSFYPTKNLGALGDGGAVVTNDAALAARVRQLRNGGQADRNCHELAGVNSRLDELHAAVLRARLPLLRGWTAKRRALAAAYRAALAGTPVVLVAEADAGHVHHLFVIRSTRRMALQEHLASRGIGTLIHYPLLIPAQPAFAASAAGHWPAAAAACNEVLSLPLHPGLNEADVRHVVSAIAEF